jgi:predicted AAA+ superfamily ATPase
VYLDNIFIYFENEKDYFKRFELILKRLRNANLIINEKKCEFFIDEVEYLRFRINANGIRINFVRVELIKN